MPRPPNVFLQSSTPTPLGRVLQGGINPDTQGLGEQRMRILGAYAIVYTLSGEAAYRDAEGRAFTLEPGDLLWVLPDLPHTYNRLGQKSWSEMWLMFEGPAFDLQRAAGLIGAGGPTAAGLRQRLEPIEFWSRRLRESVSIDETDVPEAISALQRVTHVLTLLAEIVRERHRATSDPEGRAWIERANALLAAFTGADAIDVPRVASEIGMTYETFRKKYARLAGIGPAHYAMERVIRRACELMHRRDAMRTNAALARACGFCDEYHFSRRFKQITGVSPSEYRRRLPGL